VFYVIVGRHVFHTKLSRTATDVDWAGSNVMTFVAFLALILLRAFSLIRQLFEIRRLSDMKNLQC